jgi:hypothetical protein
MWMVALLGIARAGALVLPPDEDPAAWASALALAGLDGGGDRVVLYRDREGWWLVPPGSVQVPVPAPHSEAGREEIAVLAASLLRCVGADLTLPALPPLLPPPAPRRAPRPAPVQPPVPAPEPVAPVTVAPPVDDLPEPLVPEVLDELITLVEPPAPREPAPWRGWWDVGAGAAWRQGVQAGPSAQLGVGAARGSARLGLRVYAGERMEIAAVGPKQGFSAVDVLPGIWLAPRDSATVGIVGGGSIRWGTDAGELAFLQTMGVVGGELGGRLTAGKVEILPRLRVTSDLATTALVHDGRDAGTLSPFQIAAEIAACPAARR